MAEALGRLCQAASSTARVSRSASPGGSDKSLSGPGRKHNSSSSNSPRGNRSGAKSPGSKSHTSQSPTDQQSHSQAVHGSSTSGNGGQRAVAGIPRHSQEGNVEARQCPHDAAGLASSPGEVMSASPDASSNRHGSTLQLPPVQSQRAAQQPQAQESRDPAACSSSQHVPAGSLPAAEPAEIAIVSTEAQVSGQGRHAEDAADSLGSSGIEGTAGMSAVLQELDAHSIPGADSRSLAAPLSRGELRTAEVGPQASDKQQQTAIESSQLQSSEGQAEVHDGVSEPHATAAVAGTPSEENELAGYQLEVDAPVSASQLVAEV